MNTDERRAVEWFSPYRLLSQIRVKDTDGIWREFQVADVMAMTDPITAPTSYNVYSTLTLYDARAFTVDVDALTDALALGTGRHKQEG